MYQIGLKEFEVKHYIGKEKVSFYILYISVEMRADLLILWLQHKVSKAKTCLSILS